MTSISDTNVVNAPGGLVELGYSENTSASTSIASTNPASPTTVISDLTFVSDGSPVIVEMGVSNAAPPSGQSMTFYFWVDGSRLGNAALTVATFGSVHVQRRLTLAAGSHTVRLVATVSSGTGTVYSGSGASGTDNPAFLRVSKIIQASQLIVQTPNAPLVTSLPSNAIDGQEVRYLADNTNGIIWNFRYRAGSSSAYKWEFIGGAPLVTQVDTDEGIVAGTTTYTALATAGPSITLALAGDYVISQGCRGYPFANNQSLHMSYDIGATPASDSDSVLLDCASGFGENGSRTKLKTGISANSAIVSKYKHTSSGAAANFAYRWMTVTPVRVSA